MNLRIQQEEQDSLKIDTCRHKTTFSRAADAPRAPRVKRRVGEHLPPINSRNFSNDMTATDRGHTPPGNNPLCVRCFC